MIPLADLEKMAEAALRNHTLYAFLFIVMEWAKEADKEIARLKSAPPPMP